VRVSVTELDSFRRWQGDEEADLETLLRQLRKQEPPSRAMLAGIALHKALEQAEPGDVLAFNQDGFRFKFVTNIELALTEFREIKAEKVYIVDGYPVTVVGKIDHMQGKRIDDHKSTARFDAERFLDSYQWRYYLDIFGADVFQWNVFEMAEDDPEEFTVFAFHPLRQYRYAAMHEDCLALLRAFLSFARAHLPERFEQAVAA
jgi:hypothetical protein